ncbi:hypothetical protein Tco_0710011 [Tanacetum coccineum]
MANMSRVQALDGNYFDKVKSALSNWKIKSFHLEVGLSLLKSVLDAQFFNGHEPKVTNLLGLNGLGVLAGQRKKGVLEFQACFALLTDRLIDEMVLEIFIPLNDFSFMV